MKTVVINHSQTGFTRRYAQRIAEAVGADCFSRSQAKGVDFSPYGAVVYGSWACAGKIRKLGWFKSRMRGWSGKRLAVFCVGASPAESPEIEPFLRRSFTDEERERAAVFYCPGGLNYEGMPLPSKLMMRAFAKSTRAKKGKTPEEEVMAGMIGASYDIADQRYIEPILAYLRG